jgi:transcriptional regulator with XRE-family HTH domain
VKLAERLGRLRAARTLSWGELRKDLDVGETTLHYLKTGERNPSPKLLRRIEAAERAAGLVPSGPDSRLTIPEPRAKPGSSDMVSRAGRSLSSLRADLAAMRAKILAEFERLEKRLDELEG